LLTQLASACVVEPLSSERAGSIRYSMPAPSESENYCAWYAEAAGGVLYFGEAAFWSAMRAAADDPMADLAVPGPQPIGRFDLNRERFIEPLDVTETGARSGVWDVLPHPNGRIYFTTFYETAGFVDPASGTSRRFPELGDGLNELAHGEDGNIIVSRYGGHGGNADASGSLVVFSPDGALVLEAPLAAPDGLALAPKTVAWDPRARRYWIAADLVWRDTSQPAPISMHPALVLDDSGREVARIDEVELHFVRFADGEASGRGVAVIEAAGELRLIELDESDPSLQLTVGRGKLLDGDFPAEVDFVQDVSFGPSDEVVVTRWSGLVHVVRKAAHAPVSSIQLPREDGLYYAAALTTDGRVCATHCHDRGTSTAMDPIDIVCTSVGGSPDRELTP